MEVKDTDPSTQTSPTESGKAPPVRIKTVSTSFWYDSFRHDLVERVGNVAIYQKIKPSIGYVGYEVVRITLRPPHPFDQKKDQYDRVEHYPASSEWGTYGWTYQTLDKAKFRFAKLLCEKAI
jgi:hypothetical protein